MQNPEEYPQYCATCHNLVCNLITKQIHTVWWKQYNPWVLSRQITDPLTFKYHKLHTASKECIISMHNIHQLVMFRSTYCICAFTMVEQKILQDTQDPHGNHFNVLQYICVWTKIWTWPHIRIWPISCCYSGQLHEANMDGKLAKINNEHNKSKTILSLKVDSALELNKAK